MNRNRHVPAEDTPAFGAIAERFRRGGDLERAVQLCRDGLTKFPNQLSARVTLGWALLDLKRYEEARAELEQVLRRAPDNLAAIRGLAELHDRAENGVLMDGPGAWPPDPESVDASGAAARVAEEPSAPAPPGPVESHDVAAEPAVPMPTQAAEVEPSSPPVFVTSAGYEMPMAGEGLAPPAGDTPPPEEDEDVQALLEESERLGEAAADHDPAAPAAATGSTDPGPVELLSPAAAAMAAAAPVAPESQPTAVTESAVDRSGQDPISTEPVDDPPVVEFSLDDSDSLDASVVALEADANEDVEEPVIELNGASVDDLADVVEAMGADASAPADTSSLHPTQSSAPPTPEIADLADLSPVVAAEQTARSFAAELRAAAPVVLRPQARATIVRLERFLKKVEARQRRLARESVA